MRKILINLSEYKKLELELNEIKFSRQYKICKKIFLPYKIIQKYFINIYNIKLKKVKKLYRNTIFQTDRKFINNINEAKKAIILGNAQNLNKLTNEKFLEYYKNKSILTIGLNRSYYSFNTEILLWADYEIIEEMSGTSSNNLENTTVIQTTNNNIRKNLLYWKKKKSFKDYSYKGLFKARNILVSALHLCYIYNIKEIELYGFEFDSREYFFKTDKYDKINEYEIKLDATIEEEYFGYDTKTIVKEVLEYMVDNDFKITYNGESLFLSSVKGLMKNGN